MLKTLKPNRFLIQIQLVIWTVIEVNHRWYRHEFTHCTEIFWGSHVDSSLKAVDIFHLSVAEISGLGARLAVWSYLLVHTPFYFSISSMNTGASFIRTTDNDVPLTISSSSVSTKSMNSIFFVPKEMLNRIKRFIWAELL